MTKARKSSAVPRTRSNVVPLLHAARKPEAPLAPGMCQGTLVQLGRDGHVWVEVVPSGRPTYCAKATATVALSPQDLGAEVTLWEVPGDVSVVLGKRVAPTLEGSALVDGNRRVVISAADEIVLECGKASITLRRNGRLVIRGVQVESRADGTNRIKGGTVQIN